MDPTRSPRSAPCALALALLVLIGPEMAEAAPGAVEGWSSEADAAFAAAVRDDRPVLVDFFGTWCPPCARMDAEVFDEPGNAPLLARFHRVRLDADVPESWPWKSRYAVRGYPTVVVAAPSGELLARQEGYESPGRTVAWLRQVTEDTRPLAVLVASAGDPAGADPRLAAEIGWRMLDQGRAADAGPWVERAISGGSPDASPLAAAAALTEPDPARRAAALAAVASRDPASADAPAWLHARVSALEEAADAAGAREAREALVSLLDARIPVAPGAVAADLFYLRGEAHRTLGRPEAAARDFRACAAAARSAIDAARDAEGRPGAAAKGWYTTLAEALEEAGDHPGAEAALREATGTWAAEFTFHNALAGFLLRRGRVGEALPEADAALRHSYGDNRLRAVDLLARARAASGDRAGAATLLRDTLASAAPPDDPGIRTHRYLKRLRERLEEVEAPSP